MLEESKQFERSLEIYEKILEIEPGNAKAKERVEAIKNRLGIFELPSKYNDIATLPAVGREDLAALLAVQLRNDLGEAPGKPPIIVDISASWASKFILKVTSLGLIDVYANHTFQPRRLVTRADLAEVLARVVAYLGERGHRFFRQIPARTDPDLGRHLRNTPIIAPSAISCPIRSWSFIRTGPFARSDRFGARGPAGRRRFAGPFAVSRGRRRGRRGTETA